MKSDDEDASLPCSLSADEEIGQVLGALLGVTHTKQHGNDMMEILKLGPNGVRDNFTILSQQFSRILELIQGTKLLLRCTLVDVLGEEGTLTKVDEAKDSASKMYWDWIEENANNEEDSMDEEGYDLDAGSDANPPSQSKRTRREYDIESSARTSAEFEDNNEEELLSGDESEPDSMMLEAELQRRLAAAKQELANEFAAKQSNLETELQKRLAAEQNKNTRLRQKLQQMDDADRVRRANEQAEAEAPQKADDDNCRAAIIIQSLCRRILGVAARKRLEREKEAAEQAQRLDAERREREKEAAELQARLDAERREIERLKAGQQLFNEIRERWGQVQAHDKKPILFSNSTTLLLQVQDTIGNAFDTRHANPQLFSIPKLCAAVITLLGPLTTANKAVTKVVDFNLGRSLASLLLDCDVDKDAGSGGKADERTEYINRLRLAIYRYTKGDDTLVLEGEELENAVGDMKSSIAVGHATKKLASHLLHIRIWYELVTLMSMDVLYAGLGREKEFTQRAQALAERVNRDTSFNGANTTVLQYIELYAIPGLENDDVAISELAREVICDIFSQLTQLVGPQRKATHLPLWKWAETMRVSQDVTGEDSIVAYCSGDNDIHRKRRRRITLTVLAMLLKRPIKQRFNSGLFGERGYIRTLLRLAPTNISEEFNFIKTAFFKGDYGKNKTLDGIVQKLKRNAILTSDGDDTGKRSIIIENEEQIESLKLLLRAE